MQFSIVDVASVFLSVNHYPREFNIPQKKHQRAGPSMTKHCGKPLHFLTKKIAFSYSDPGATLQNKLNNLKPVPLYSRKKSFVVQKKLKKMLLHWRVNLANQNKQQPQEDACHIPYMTSHYETNLWSTHVNIVRLAEPIRQRMQVFKIEGFVCKRFLLSPPPPPS